MRPVPDWLVVEPVDDIELGVVTSGKEAQIDLVERTGHDGRSCLVARKRYLPREVHNKGELEALGFQRASTFRHDVRYREGRQFRKSRDRRAVERMTSYGKHLLQDRWTGHEYDVMSTLWDAGLSVPYPIGYSTDVLELEFIGDRDGAAPQLRSAPLGRPQLEAAFEQLVDGLIVIVSAGWSHGDLSAYNLLWWDDRLWFIDFPQAVDIAANPMGLDFLHRDVTNVCEWFDRRGLDVDGEALFAQLLGVM
ncbi:MAG: serine/threonine protein kinase [Acidimicrobiaceae bacterium]|nr:serine/threonine protein kinase [Acidimicrobiaceae bacterium]